MDKVIEKIWIHGVGNKMYNPRTCKLVKKTGAIGESIIKAYKLRKSKTHKT